MEAGTENKQLDAEIEAQSFVIRIWLERGDSAHDTPELRGWISHLPSGYRLYFREVSAIGDFVHRYTLGLEERANG